MIATDWYKHWFNSPYYHQLYFQHGQQEAKNFIDNLLQYLKPAVGSRMFDVACGRGRHACYLSSQGFDVTGIDLSEASITFAKQFENDHLHFYQHDMRLPAWAAYFDYAFNFFTSFGYFATRRENDDAMRTIAQSVKHDGTVVIDYLNVHYAEERLVRDETRKVDDTVFEIRRWHDASFFYKCIKVFAKDLSAPLEFTEKVAKLSLGDFNDMLSYQHLQVQQVFGNYDLNAYDVKRTPRLILIAKKVQKAS